MYNKKMAVVWKFM